MEESHVQRTLCRTCKHFYITYDTKMPYGCKSYNFKSKQLPCIEVKDSDGEDCLAYEQKAGSSRLTPEKDYFAEE